MAERWLTYQQAGDALGMSAEAVRQRARRLGWRTQPGNEGRALVLVPDGVEARPRVRPAVQPPDQTPVQPAGQTGEAAGLAELRAAKAEGESATLRERMESERARAERAEAEREVAKVAAARAEGEATTLREQITAERERAEAARAELADWTAGGPFARAWRALLYRRGRP